MTLPDLLAEVDAAAAELLNLYRNLISFPTVNTGQMPTGHETPCAQFLAQHLDRLGADAEVLEGAPQRGNLVARWPGRGTGRSLLLLGHLDVVPPGDTTRWTYPPFDPVVRDGWVHGRGSNDCKGLVASEVMVLGLLAHHAVRLNGDVKLIASADEEAGGGYGAGFLAAQHPDWLAADLGVNEGGGTMTRLHDGGLGCLVAVGEKGRHEVTVTIHGSSNHAALPWLADNPLLTLSEVLRLLSEHRPAVAVDNPFVQLTGRLWGQTSQTPGDLERLLRLHEQRHSDNAMRVRALSRMTITPTVVSGGGKSNAVPDRVTLTLDVRSLPPQTGDDVLRELLAILGDVPGVEFAVSTTADSSHSDLTPEISAALTAALAAAGAPGTELLGTGCPGFTDSRYARLCGTPVFGFSPTPPDADLSRCGCHNIDEQFPFETVLFRTKVLLALAWEWCGYE